MLKLRDIMTRDVLTVSPELSVRDAMELFASRHVSGAPVVRGEAVVGVISATDLMAHAAAMPTSSPTPPDEEAEWEEEEELSEWEEDGDAPASFFTDLWDEASDAGVDRFGTQRSGGWNTLADYTVADAMTEAPVCSMTPDTPVTLAADYMRRAEVHRLLVMEGQVLLGIVTSTDITRAVADRRLTSRTLVFGDRGRLEY